MLRQPCTRERSAREWILGVDSAPWHATLFFCVFNPVRSHQHRFSRSSINSLSLSLSLSLFHFIFLSFPASVLFRLARSCVRGATQPSIYLGECLHMRVRTRPVVFKQLTAKDERCLWFFLNPGITWLLNDTVRRKQERISRYDETRSSPPRTLLSD